MTVLAPEIKKIRETLGFSSARQFYLHLAGQAELGFNYSYFMRIEGGKTLPSHEVIRTLCRLLSPEHSNRIVLAYCASLFPQQRPLFSRLLDLQSSTALFPEPGKKAPSAPTTAQKKRNILSEKQVSVLGRSETHYNLFLLLTLARRAIPESDLIQRLGAKTQTILKEFEENKLAYLSSEGWMASSSESGFPEATGATLKKLYQQFDDWDKRFASRFQFNSHRDKMMIRRISGRFASLIATHCDLIIDLIRGSEETVPDLMDEVVYFQLSLSSGKVPG